MTDITDAQELAAENAAADAADDEEGGGLAPGSHEATAETFVSGTARQVSDRRDAHLYITVKTAAALKVEIGPDSDVEVQLTPSQSSALGMMQVFVPGGWYVKLTGTMANLDVTSVLA